MNTWFTADTHFQHANIIKYCHRPFVDIIEHDEVLIKNWNNLVKTNDLIYIIGDFGFGDVENILRRLNGTKILILGSHDKSALEYKQYFTKISPLMEINIDGQPIILCHYAMRTWSKSHYNSWHLYGHSHNTLESFGKSFDVGVDGHDFTPWSFDEIKDKMEILKNNFNLIKEK